MKLSKQLNSKGFSHIETLLILVVIAVIGVTGFYVWNRNKTNNTAHAATYSYIGAGKIWTTYPHTSTQYIAFNGYACKEKISGVNYIKALLITDKSPPKSLQVTGYMASYASVTKPIGINWIKYNYSIWSGNTVYDLGRHKVDYSRTNLIRAWAGGSYGGQATSLSPHASSLSQC